MRGSEVSLIRAVRGPITLITLGVLFALNNFTPYRFHQTWPVLLIVFGLLSLLRRSTEPPPPDPGPAIFPPPGANFPPPGTSGGGYRASTYTVTAEPQAAPPPVAGPSKGGFGSSAPQRPGEPSQGSGDSV